VFMALLLMVIEAFYGMNCLVCLAGRTCPSALGGLQRFSFS
jgi:hypothetical protein